MIRYAFAVVSILGLFATLSLILLFSNNSVSGLAQYSIGSCALPDGFENKFTSKTDCALALVDLCSSACPFEVSNCVRYSKRSCSFVGRSEGGI